MLEKPTKILAVVIWKNQAKTLVLLLKRDASNGGYWQPITGGMEEGESPEQAVLRELREETGLTTHQPPCYLGMDYEFVGKWGPARERAFRIEIKSETTPNVILDDKEHIAYEWCSPEEAIKRAKFSSNKEAIRRAVIFSPLYLSKEGDWSQDGQLVTHERTIALLHKNLWQKESGEVVVKCGQEEVPVIAEDTILFVRSFEDEGSLLLINGTKVKLLPEQIYLRDHVLYAIIDGQEARFLRPAYYQIMKFLEERSVAGKTQYVLHWRGRDYPLAVIDHR